MKEENFSLKLRIYMLEEEKSERDENDEQEAAKKSGAAKEGPNYNKASIEPNDNSDLESTTTSTSSTLSSSTSVPVGLEATLSGTNGGHDNGAHCSHRRHRHRRRRRRRSTSQGRRGKHRSTDNFYASDAEQKEIELENLNRIVRVFVSFS